MSLETITALALSELPLPEPRQVVPGLLTEGLNILAAPPKSGKSFLSLGISLALTNGKLVLDRIEAKQMGVLYLALEDTLYRLKNRIKGLHQPASDLLHLATRAPRLAHGALDHIDAFLAEHPEVGMVVIDTLAKISDQKTGGNVYDEDSAMGGALHSLAHHHGAAFLVVHHTRKAAHGDFLQAVSGSLGFTGAADTVLVMGRERSKTTATLEVTGRDIHESKWELEWYSGRGGWIASPRKTSNEAARAFR